MHKGKFSALFESINERKPTKSFTTYLELEEKLFRFFFNERKSVQNRWRLMQSTRDWSSD